MIGCIRRVMRLFHSESGRTVLVSLDGGVTDGLSSGLPEWQKEIFEGNGESAQGVIMHKGLARAFGTDLPPWTCLIMHLSAGTRHGLPPYNRSLVCSLNEALRLGADAVSIQVNIGNDFEDRMLTDLGAITDEAHQLGLPVLAQVFARGGQIVNESDPTLVAHGIRLGMELGADLVLSPYSGDPESFGQAVRECPVPVVIQVGPRYSDAATLLAAAREGLEAGAVGVCLAPGLFHPTKPSETLSQMGALVHQESAAFVAESK